MNVKKFFSQLKHINHQYKLEQKFRITYDIVANVLLFFIVTALLFGLFAGGVGLGYFASLVKEEPIRPYEEMKKDIYNYEETSKLYFADNIYIGDIRSDLHREEIALKDVSDLIQQAVIATEDELFYQHNGIVPKAIVRALLQEVTNSDRKTGGSTLTQQLIKNQILTNEVSFERKAKEILLALRLENFFEKDEILEAYLNIVPYGREASGRNIAGIQTAAKGIFGLDAHEVNLAQAAFLAGLPQNPFTYTPFTNDGKVKKGEELTPGINRMKTVLLRMYQTGIITEKEYQEALDYDIAADFTEKSISPIDEYPAIVFELEQRATNILKGILAKEDGFTEEDLQNDAELDEQYMILADRALRRNGYQIHSTIHKKMYDMMQKIVADYPYYGPNRTFTKDGQTVTEQVENSMVLIENKSGRILSFIPGRDYRVGGNVFNYATQAYRSPGSTFKPFTYAAGFELGKMQPGTVIADIPTSYGGYSPKNYGGNYYGLVTIREAITYSYNVTAVKAYSNIMNDNPIGQFLSKLGFKKLDQSEAGNRALALGGLTEGVTVEENTGAFASFANGGKYNDTHMIDKIVDKDGKVIYEHKAEPVEVFSPQTAYLMLDTMRDVVRSGTAAYMQSQLRYGGVDWAGKTGTSQDYKDAWFIATNPNVTLGSWIGYDTPASIYCPNCSLSYHPRNIKVWAQVVNELTAEFPDIMAPKERFKQPEGIVTRSFCATSGLIPSKLCQSAGLTKSDLFNAKYVPNKEDDSLIGGNMPMVQVDGRQVVAHERTPSEFTSSKSGGILFNPDFLKRMNYDQLSDLSLLIPRKSSEAWTKIGFGKASSASGTAISESERKSLSTPGPIHITNTKISWPHKKGQLIVGYRIYHTNEGESNYSLIGHTVTPSYSLPAKPGKFYVRAVNYFGEESSSSEAISLVAESEDEIDDELEDEVDANKDEETGAKKEKDKKEEKEKKEEKKEKEKDKKKTDKEEANKKEKTKEKAKDQDQQN